MIDNYAFNLTDKQTIIGRMTGTSNEAPSIDLRHLTASQTISREHFSVEWDGQRHYLICLKNVPNKVYLNNQELGLYERVLVMDGDIIVFGDILARFECLVPGIQLPRLDQPYVRLRWLGMGSAFYIQKNPGFIGRGRKKCFPKDLLAFDFEPETRDVLSLSRPHAKLWIEADGHVYLKSLKEDALVWLDGERITDTVEVKNDASLKLARLLFHIQLLA